MPTNEVTLADITFIDADDGLRTRIGQEWNEQAARHMHIEDGFSIVGFHEDCPISLISVYWKPLPPPLPPTQEGYIDTIEVLEPYRRKGIARKMVELSLKRAEEKGVYQVRAWSTNDKLEAIPMWKSLGFALCPVTHGMWGVEITGYFVAKRLE